jgi:hypothetical protein
MPACSVSTDWWQGYVAAANVIGGFSTGLAVLIGGFSIGVILFQTRQSTIVSNQLSALQSQKDYIRVCLEYPDLSSSLMMSKTLKLTTFEGILNICKPQTERALWFLSYVLFAVEQEILTYSRRGAVDESWRQLVEEQIGYHAQLLQEVWPSWRHMYSREMDQMVTLVLQKEFERPEIDIGWPFRRSTASN